VPIQNRDSRPVSKQLLETVEVNRLPATIRLSVVLPVFNEESNLREMHSRLSTMLDELGLFAGQRGKQLQLARRAPPRMTGAHPVMDKVFVEGHFHLYNIGR